MIEANRTVGAAPRPRPTRRWVWIAAALVVLVVAVAGVLVGVRSSFRSLTCLVPSLLDLVPGRPEILDFPRISRCLSARLAH